jgi:hypothetical protein
MDCNWVEARTRWRKPRPARHFLNGGGKFCVLRNVRELLENGASFNLRDSALQNGKLIVYKRSLFLGKMQNRRYVLQLTTKWNPLVAKEIGRVAHDREVRCREKLYPGGMENATAIAIHANNTTSSQRGSAKGKDSWPKEDLKAQRTGQPSKPEPDGPAAASNQARGNGIVTRAAEQASKPF